jgi:hypothetical protein
MATKFSDFNSETTLSNVTGLVGYISSSNTNVRISPTDLSSGISKTIDEVIAAGNQLTNTNNTLDLPLGGTIEWNTIGNQQNFAVSNNVATQTFIRLVTNGGELEMDDSTISLASFAGKDLELKTGGNTDDFRIYLGTSGPSVGDVLEVKSLDGNTGIMGWATPSGGGASDIDGLTDCKTQDSSSAGRFSIWIANGTTAGGAAQTGTLSDARGNLCIGASAGKSITSADYCVLLGQEAGDAVTTGGQNTVMGGFALSAVSTGSQNTAIGYASLQQASTAVIKNTAIGAFSMQSAAVTGAENAALGFGSMQNCAAGNKNSSFGALSLFSLDSGITNAAIGYRAGYFNTSGSQNLYLGAYAGGVNTGSYQMALGYDVATTQASSLALGRNGQILLHGDYATAGQTKLGVNLGSTWTAPTANLHVKGGGGTNTTFLIESQGGAQLMKLTETGQNILIGARAGDSITSSNFNVLIGSDAGTNITGTNGDNVAIGKSANSTGSPYWNVAIGAEALQNAAGAAHVAVGKTAMKGGGGLYSTALGFQAGYKTGNHSVAIGAQAMGGTSASNSGVGNIAIGYQTMNTGSARTGQYNIALGYQAGAIIASASDNILIGRGVNPSSNSATDELRIGKNTVLPLAANLSTGAVTINQAYTLPVADGTPNQVLQTDGAGNISFATASGGGGLTPTTQTTNYTASANDFVICNVTTSLVVTLPAASSGAIVGVKYASQNAATDVCSVLTPAGVQIDGVVRSATALVLPSLNTYYEFISDGTNWFIK